MTSPTHHAATEEVAGWFNYEFETDLDCPNKCGPGVHPLYVGKSNDSLRRLLEHAKSQPWFKHVTGWKIHPERYATEQQSLAAEAQRIRTRRPLANKAGNEANPCRIDFGALTPRRRPSARRMRASSGPSYRGPGRTNPVTRRIRRRQRWQGLETDVAALAISVLTLWWLACTFAHVSVRAGLLAAAAGVAAAVLAFWWRRMPKRSVRRVVTSWAAGGAALLALWGLAGMPESQPVPVPQPTPAVSR